MGTSTGPALNGQRQHLKCSISLKLNDCKTGWQMFSIGGVPKCFKNFGDQLISSAVSICTNADAVLPLPHTAQEQADYVNALNAMGGISEIAIGANDLANEGTFANQNNAPLAFNAWHTSEPNDGGDGPSGTKEDYIVMNLNWPSTSNWNDVQAIHKLPIVCEN